MSSRANPTPLSLGGLAAWRLGGLSLSLVRDAEGWVLWDVLIDHQPKISLSAVTGRGDTGQVTFDRTRGEVTFDPREGQNAASRAPSDVV